MMVFRPAAALALALVLAVGSAAPVLAKGNSISREPSRFFEGVPIAAPEANSLRRHEQQFRAPRKSGGCVELD